MNTYDEFYTQDIVLAAVLKVKGFILDRIEKNGNKGTFYFIDVDKHLVGDYDLGKITVEPTGFNNAIKALTTAIRRQV